MEKKTFACITCTVVLFGCSRYVSDDPEQLEIRFQGNIQKLQPVVVGASRAGFSEGDKVQLYIVEQEGNENTITSPASEDFHSLLSDADGKLSFTDGKKHLYPDHPIDVYGYYCKGMENFPTDLSSFPVLVAGDQTTSEAMIGSDFLYVKAANGYTAGDVPIGLVFEHQFSELQFNIATNTPATVDLEELTMVEVLNVLTEGTFDLSSGNLVLGETLDDVRGQPQRESSVIILPQTVAAGRSLFRFVVKDQEFVCTILPEDKVFEKGKLYRYNIWLNKYPGVGDKEIQISSSIVDWDESEPPLDIIIGKGEEVMVTLTDVASGVTITRADLYLMSGDMPSDVKDVAVTEGKMKFVFPRQEVGGTVKVEKAHFYTSDGNGFDYYFSGKELTGNNFDKLSLSLPGIGDAWGDGTIFVVGVVTSFDSATFTFKTDVTGINAYRGRVVSNFSLGSFCWGKSRSAGEKVLVGANSRDDGKVNMNKLKEFVKGKDETLELYPAFRACDDLDGEWYYPAVNEMKAIITNRNVLNVNIENQKGEVIKLATYGSSTEKGNVDYIATDSKGTGDFPTTKIGISEIRAVRAY